MYYVGVDGGGTKTATVACDRDGRVVGRSLQGGSNPNFVGEEPALAHMAAGIREATAGIDGAAVSRVALCVAGLSRIRTKAADRLGLAPSALTFASDTLSTFYGALGKESGVVVLAGTGSFAMGAAPGGSPVSIGGWGPIVGDDGSGQRMAALAIRAAARAFDGIGPPTLLSDKLLAHYKIDNLHQLKSIMALDNVSKLTYAVREAADEGDAAALAIVRDCARELADLASGLLRRIGMDGRPCEVALAGGLWKLGERLKLAFAERMGELHPQARVVPAAFPPSIGAVLLAMRADGIRWTESLLAAIQSTMTEEEEAPHA